MYIKKDQIYSIQALRAIAVMTVIYHHAIISSEVVFKHSFLSHYYFFWEWGRIGVDLFFVISGFIMTRIARSYVGKWKLFILKRGIRIIPLYWGLTAFVLLFRSIQNLPIDLPGIKKTILFFPVFEVENFVFPSLNVGWTLSFEIYFYFLITIFLGINTSNIYYKIIMVLCVLSLIGLFNQSDSVLFTFITSPLLLEFGMGLFCGIVYDKIGSAGKRTAQLAWCLTIIGLLASLSSIFWRYGSFAAHTVVNDNKQAFFRSITLGIPCAILLLGYVLLESINIIKIPKFIKLLGDASYSNYLVHIFVISATVKFNSRLSIDFDFFNADIYVLILVIVCTLISIPFYWYLERPLTIFIGKNIIINNLRAKKSV